MMNEWKKNEEEENDEINAFEKKPPMQRMMNEWKTKSFEFDLFVEVE